MDNFKKTECQSKDFCNCYAAYLRDVATKLKIDTSDVVKNPNVENLTRLWRKISIQVHPDKVQGYLNYKEEEANMFKDIVAAQNEFVHTCK